MLFYRKIAIVRYFEEFIYSEKSVKVLFFFIYFLFTRTLFRSPVIFCYTIDIQL